MSITVFQLEKVQLLCSICTEEVTCGGIRMPDTRFFSSDSIFVSCVVSLQNEYARQKSTRQNENLSPIVSKMGFAVTGRPLCDMQLLGCFNDN